MSTAPEQTTLRNATPLDGARIHEFAAACPPLELNTTYAYVLMATHFAASSAIAEDSDGLAGYVVGYRLPEDPETLFVWQIGVHPRARGTGLARKLLNFLIHRPGKHPVRYLEATVAPSNEASQRLFRGFAKSMDVPCEVRPCFTAEHFGGNQHEPEALFRVGPFSAAPQETGESNP